MNRKIEMEITFCLYIIYYIIYKDTKTEENEE